jgi:hypothetical protein
MGHQAGVPKVLTAPLTESDHAGFFIQMSLASIPRWMEWAIDKKYTAWREVPRTAEGRAGTAPAGAARARSRARARIRRRPGRGLLPRAVA